MAGSHKSTAVSTHLLDDPGYAGGGLELCVRVVVVETHVITDGLCCWLYFDEIDKFKGELGLESILSLELL